MPLMVYIAGMSMQQAAAMSLMIVAMSRSSAPGNMAGEAWSNPWRRPSAGPGWLDHGVVPFGHRLIREEVLLVLFRSVVAAGEGHHGETATPGG